VNRLLLKPDLPLKYEYTNESITCLSDFASIKKGSVIESIDNIKLNSAFQLEFYLDSKNSGDSILIVSDIKGQKYNNKVILISYYDLSFIIISSIIGLAFLLSGLFAIVKRTDDVHARILFWILLLFALAVITSPGKYYPGIDIAGFIVRISHTVSFIFGISVFLYFSFVFPVKKEHWKIYSLITFLPAVILVITLTYFIITSMILPSAGWFKTYEFMWSVFVQTALGISMLLGIFVFYFSSRKFQKKEEKNKIKWILWGISIGVFPYIILFIIPSALGSIIPNIISPSLLIPEQISMLTFLLIPVSFVFAVIKYQLFDIEVIINRSIVYSVLTIFIVMLYFSVIAIGSLFFKNLLSGAGELTYFVAAFAIALLINPIRMKVQHFVDVTLYREKYNIEKSIKIYTEKISRNSTLSTLGKTAIEEIEKLIPAKKIAILVVDKNRNGVRVLAENNIEQLSAYIGDFRLKKQNIDLLMSIALEGKVQPEIKINTSLSEFLKRWEIDLVIPLTIDLNNPLGAFIFGSKLSGLKYSFKDIELLNILASETSIALSRLLLQEELFLKEIERQQLEELSALKSFFVSSITHDLKTPLTSIKMFVEMLKDKKHPAQEKKDEYLSIIEGESDRLSQLIDNVLIYSKIENKIQQYDFEFYCLNDLVEEVLELMKYQFRINRFFITIELGCKDAIIRTDRKSFQSVLINLLSNAIKYSHKQKEIKIITGLEKNYAYVTVVDKGDGIPEEDLKNIFNPFFRSRNQITSKIHGTGLGLSIVKRVIEDHNGKIYVTSSIGKGSSFKLLFPIETNNQN
jgi:signal transduction histidine kinase